MKVAERGNNIITKNYKCSATPLKFLNQNYITMSSYSSIYSFSDHPKKPVSKLLLKLLHKQRRCSIATVVLGVMMRGHRCYPAIGFHIKHKRLHLFKGLPL